MRKSRFDIEKQGKGRKKGAVRRRVPKKQGLKPAWHADHGSQEMVRRRVPKKQGLKQWEGHKCLMLNSGVRRRVPKKQGLKRKNMDSSNMEKLCPKASSKKTRIETIFSVWGEDSPGRPKASSKKTRIETIWLSDPTSARLDVRRRVPKKQGLKQHASQQTIIPVRGPKASSKKTRIETR